MLQDKFGRTIDYLRLAVTDRCNLRCHYCMPEEGIKYVDRQALLTYEEMDYLVDIFVEMGIRKVRITGGEPFLRKGIANFLEKLSYKPLEAIHITTNGTLTKDHIPLLSRINISGVNLSLDAVDPIKFESITRRKGFDTVMETLDLLCESGIRTKINMVVMSGINTDQIVPMLELAKNRNIGVRFIEEMPFNGSGERGGFDAWNYKDILNHIQDFHPDIVKLKDEKNTTSYNYGISGYKGNFGVIPAYSRTICGACNRIRLTPQGTLKTCLYDSGIFNIKDFIRAGASQLEIKALIAEAVSNKHENGFAAERERTSDPVSESMATIGG